jgi:peroxiredoxin
MKGCTEMTWIRFDESDHWKPAPAFCLPALKEGRAGGQICLDVYRENCNLALFFTHGRHCPGCLRALETFARRMGDYRDLETQILAIFPDRPEELAAKPGLARLPFPLVSDRGNRTRQSYAGLVAAELVGEGDSLLFVLDRYNAPYAALVNAEGREGSDIFARDDTQDDILKWFEYIGVQCPE